jgi:hypothetical protein
MEDKEMAAARNRNSSSDSTQSSQMTRTAILKRYAEVTHRDMNPDERAWWEKFLKDYALGEIEYAFETWLAGRSGNEWWPTAQQISDLCKQYRHTEAQKLLPVGCERCDWTGFYETTGKTVGSDLYPGKEVKPGGVERLVLPCPCQADPSLRTPCTKKKASDEELRVMWTLVKEMCELKKFPEGLKAKVSKYKQISNLVPTTKELAAQLQKDREHKSRKPPQRELDAVMRFERRG